MVDSAPVFKPRPLPRRIFQLYLGLVAYGVSMVMMLQAHLGLMPWDVLHQGIALQGGWPMGRVAIVVGAMVLLAWIPLRQLPGLGTISNVIVIGLVFDTCNQWLGSSLAALELPSRIALLVAGIALNGLATAAYIAARFGPGPRDGLMTGLARRTGRSLRLVRSSIEAGVLLIGFLLGGTLGVGTLLYALAVGPLVQFLLRALDPQPAPVSTPAAVS